MQESTIPPETTRKKRPWGWGIAIGVLILVAVAFFASRAGLDKALVKQQVDGFIVQLRESAKAQGRHVDLTYRDLEVAGGLTNKHVVMHDPVFTIKPLEPTPNVATQEQPTNALRVTTARVLLFPKAADLSALSIEAHDPIDLAGEEDPTKSLLKISSPKPLTVTVANTRIGDALYSELDAALPAALTFVYLRETQAEGKEEETPTLVPVYKTLTLTAQEGGRLTTRFAQDHSGLGEATIDYRNIVITPEDAPGEALTVAEIVGAWANSLNEKKQSSMQAKLSFGPVTSANPETPYQPVALKLEGSFEAGVAPAAAAATAPAQGTEAAPEAVAPAAGAPESVITLKEFALTTKDANLTATANFTASATDVLPVGNANLTLTNAPFVLAELQAAGLLDEADSATVVSILERVTGTKAAEMKDIIIPIERARGGAFRIGNSTFEELFALLLQGAMQSNASEDASAEEGAEPGDEEEGEAAPLMPQLPDADAPKAAPIAVPDPSVRG
jgi:hypothetical protein